MNIPFNKPYLSGNELKYIKEAVESGKISGDGLFTKKCHEFFTKTYGFKKSLLTTSCTDALEMSAILSNIQLGDEVIVPSFTFVSTANAFVLRGAKIVFADSSPQHPNIDPKGIEELITSKTKAIVVVHYGGVACEMDEIMSIAKKHNIIVIEDAAQSIDSYYKDQPLGSIGTFGTFSFHETKNIICGEGGMLTINDKTYFERSEVIREKGTNRSAFFRGEINKYGWVDIGSSFLPSDLNSAFLYAQLQSLKDIQQIRISHVKKYQKGLSELIEEGHIYVPNLPEYATENGHIFYFICKSSEERSQILQYLKAKGIYAVFHYLPLHESDFFKSQYEGLELPNTVHFSEKLVRLPLFPELKESERDYIIEQVITFYKKR